MSLALRRCLLLPTRQAGRRGFSALVSMEHEFPDLPQLNPQPAKATTLSVSTLSNGLTVVTEDASVNSTLMFTFPKAGSANERVDELGAALMNKFMCYRSGSGVSTIRINRTLEDYGGIPRMSVDRHKLCTYITVTPDDASDLVPLLAVDCAFEPWDYRDAKYIAQAEVEAASESAQVMLTEHLYAGAYGPQTPGGRSLYWTDISLENAAEFRRRTVGMNGAILAATGVKDHSAFCSAVADSTADFNGGTNESPVKMTYLGGESRIGTSAGYAHVALGFKSPTSSAVSGILKHLINIVGAERGVSGFVGAGLVGTYAATSAPEDLMDKMIDVFLTKFDSDLVKRAKLLAKAEALFTLDSGSSALARVMTAVVMNEAVGYTGPADVAKAFEAVTEAEVHDALSAMLKENPTLAAIGNISSVPYHAAVASQFK